MNTFEVEGLLVEMTRIETEHGPRYRGTLEDEHRRKVTVYFQKPYLAGVRLRLKGHLKNGKSGLVGVHVSQVKRVFEDEPAPAVIETEEAEKRTSEMTQDKRFPVWQWFGMAGHKNSTTVTETAVTATRRKRIVKGDEHADVSTHAPGSV